MPPVGAHPVDLNGNWSISGRDFDDDLIDTEQSFDLFSDNTDDRRRNTERVRLESDPHRLRRTVAAVTLVPVLPALPKVASASGTLAWRLGSGNG